MSERSRRIWAAAEARSIGWGGVSLVAIPATEDQEHPVEVEAKLVHFDDEGPYRAPRSAAMGVKAYGSDCGRG